VVGLAHDNDDDDKDKEEEEEDIRLVTRAERALENEPAWNTVGGVEGETFLRSVARVVMMCILIPTSSIGIRICTSSPIAIIRVPQGIWMG
jgi:hypothetical protein